VQLSGSTVLVTGATGGIGQAIARALGSAGAKLILTGRRSDVLQPLAAELGATALAVDLADRAAVDQLIIDAGRVDVLVANAALPASGRLESYTQEQMDRALEVNLRAPIAIAHALIPAMIERGAGHLLFVSSLSGKAATPGSSLYSASKFGLRGFASGLRADLRGDHVGVSTIFPGFIRDAGMFADADVQLPPGVGTRSPEDVAKAVVRAIEHNRAELDVAPFALRAGTAFAGLAPELAATFGRRMGAQKVSDQMEAGQRDKR